MKTCSLFLLFIIIPALSAKSQTANCPPEEYHNDLNIFHDIIELIQPDIGLYTRKDESNTLFSKLHNQIDSGITPREFYIGIAQIQALSGFGNNICHDDFLYNAPFDTLPCLFPLQIKLIDSLTVIRCNSNNINRGATLQSINGIPIRSIIKKMLPIISADGYNLTMKYRILEEKFPFLYNICYGQASSFIITYLKKNQSTQTDTIQAINKNDVLNFFKKNERPYQLTITSPSTAILTINSFYTYTPQETRHFFSFIRRSFKTIDKQKIKNLILDLRQNNKGDDINIQYLASYLFNTSFHLYSNQRIKTLKIPYPEYLSQQYCTMLNFPQTTSPAIIAQETQDELQEKYTIHKTNDFETPIKADDYIIPSKKRFKGKLYVLISGKTFSKAALLCALLRDKTDALFIGEETGGGYYRHTGTTPIIYTLPHSGITFSLYTTLNKHNINRPLMPEGRGIIPHHTTTPKLTEYIWGEDTVMKSCLNIIRKNNL